MKLTWNRETKRLAALLALSGVIIILLCNFVMAGYRQRAGREYSMVLAALVGSVMEAYPETSEEALIQVLNSDQRVDTLGEQLLARYGVFVGETDLLFARPKRRINGLQFKMNLLFLLLLLGLSAVVFCYLCRQQENIRGICGYMEELSRGNYWLDIQDNGDDELSGLKNEVYKLTVFFREQARQAADNRRALADSVADISHQLKTPLTSVTVLVDNLFENQAMEENTRRRFLAEISRQLSGVTWLVTTLLKLSRLEAGVVELEQKPLQVRRLAEEVCEKLELNAEWNQVKLQVDLPEEIQINGDFGWLQEALLNVVKNAIEHSPAESKVELAGAENDVYTLFTVHNWGEEIPEEEQKHLFERFYRGGKARADSAGIGLALAKEIIVRQGGYITVESGKDTGTTFLIKFLKCH